MSTVITDRITVGPGELDIMMSVFRRGGCHWHPTFTFEEHGRVSVHVYTVSGQDQEQDMVLITGFVFCNDRNHQRYHYFSASYNVQTRTGEATFEATCKKCGAEVNKYGFCETCEARVRRQYTDSM